MNDNLVIKTVQHGFYEMLYDQNDGVSKCNFKFIIDFKKFCNPFNYVRAIKYIYLFIEQ